MCNINSMLQLLSMTNKVHIYKSIYIYIYIYIHYMNRSQKGTIEIEIQVPEVRHSSRIFIWPIVITASHSKDTYPKLYITYIPWIKVTKNDFGRLTPPMSLPVCLLSILNASSPINLNNSIQQYRKQYNSHSLWHSYPCM